MSLKPNGVRRAFASAKGSLRWPKQRMLHIAYSRACIDEIRDIEQQLRAETADASITVALSQRATYLSDGVISFLVHRQGTIWGFGKRYLPSFPNRMIGPLTAVRGERAVVLGVEVAQALHDKRLAAPLLHNSQYTVIFEWLSCPTLMSLFERNPAKLFDYVRAGIRGCNALCRSGVPHYDPNWGNMLVRSLRHVLFIDFDRKFERPEVVDETSMSLSVAIDQLFEMRQVRWATLTRVEEVARVISEEMEPETVCRLKSTLGAVDELFLKNRRYGWATKRCIALLDENLSVEREHHW